MQLDLDNRLPSRHHEFLSPKLKLTYQQKCAEHERDKDKALGPKCTYDRKKEV